MTEEQKKFLLGLKPEEMTKEFFDTYFAITYDKNTGKMIPAKISFQDKFILKANEYSNPKEVETNVGQFIINKYLYEPSKGMQKSVGYVAEPFSAKQIKAVESGILSKALLDGVITVDEMAAYFDRIQWLGNTVHTIVAPSFTPKTTTNLEKIKKKRDELYEKHKVELAKGNVVLATQIEDELLALAKKELESDIGMSLYTSGTRGSFDNNYKNLFITRGPVYNPNSGKFQIVKRSFMEGLEKDDIPSYGTEVINGAYPKAMETAVAGYATKKFFAAYQSIVLDSRGSDCKTKAYRVVQLTNKNASRMMYRYIIEGEKLIMLDNSNIKSYIGKTVKMRSPLYCTGDKLCSKCAGDLFYRIGIENIGLTTSSVGSSLLKLLMKSFHDSTVKISDIDLNKMIL